MWCTKEGFQGLIVHGTHAKNKSTITQRTPAKVKDQAAGSGCLLQVCAQAYTSNVEVDKARQQLGRFQIKNLIIIVQFVEIQQCFICVIGVIICKLQLVSSPPRVQGQQISQPVCNQTPCSCINPTTKTAPLMQAAQMRATHRDSAVAGISACSPPQEYIVSCGREFGAPTTTTCPAANTNPTTNSNNK